MSYWNDFHGIREAIDKQTIEINKTINELSKEIPYQSELEKNYKEIENENFNCKRREKEYKRIISERNKTIDELLDYIQKIVKEQEIEPIIEIKEFNNPEFCINTIEYETITIPEFRIVRFNKEKQDNNIKKEQE